MKSETKKLLTNIINLLILVLNGVVTMLSSNDNVLMTCINNNIFNFC